MTRKIKCAKCRFAQQDITFSDYTKKPCSKCNKRKDCEISKNKEAICTKQVLKWAAYKCTNPKSEFHRLQLNVSANGDKQKGITWSGCERGEVKA